MVYRFLLCFEEVNFGEYLCCIDVEPRGDGVWLQHNPDNNLLAIMSETVRYMMKPDGNFTQKTGSHSNHLTASQFF
jgi:hypothetical protein